MKTKRGFITWIFVCALMLAALTVFSEGKDDEASPPDLDAILRDESAGPEPAGYALFETFDGYGTGAVNFPQGGWNWVSTSGSYTPMWTIQSSLTSPTATAYSTPSAARFYSFIVPSGQSGRLYRTTGVDLSQLDGVNVDLSFYMYHSTGSSTLNDSLQVTISTDGGNNWSLIGPVISRYDATAGWKLHTQSLNAYTGTGFNDVRIGFHGVSAYGYNIFIDNVSISYPGPYLAYTSSAATGETCLLGGPGENNGVVEPGETVNFNVTLNNNYGDQAATGISAELSSTTPGVAVTASSSAYPDMPVSGSGTNSTPFVFKASQFLSCGDTLDFNLHVTAAGGFAWNIPISVTVGSTITAYQENFDSGITPPTLPTGWLAQNIAGNGYWQTAAAYACSNPNDLRYRYSTAGVTVDSWVFSPGISLSAGTTYTLALNERVYSASYPEVLSIYVGTGQVNTAMPLTLLTPTTFTNGTCAPLSYTFTVPSTGTYYLGFHCTSADNMFYMVVDDIKVTYVECTPCPDPCPTTTITLSPASPLPPGQPGVPYSQTITAAGGVAPYGYTLTGGALPPGLSLNTGTGLVDGTPTTAGVYSFTITATDASSCEGFLTYTMEVCGTISLSPATLPSGNIGTAYSQTITAGGGTAPYAFSVQAGTLPDGLTLSGAGALAGSPTTLGTFNFDVAATDLYGCTGVQSYSIRVCPLLTLAPGTLPHADINKPYSQVVSASGGSAPYIYAVTSGVLPAGISFAPDTGLLAGTPTESGVFSFIITATDNTGCAIGSAYTLGVFPPFCGDLAISVPSLGTDSPDWPSTHGTQTMRMYRDGVPSGCGTKTCPGTSGSAGARPNDIYQFTNEGCTDLCVTATLTTGGTCATSLMAAAYLGSFDPSNICTNYLGDAGYSFAATGSGSFKFTIPAGQSAVVVINALDMGGTCAGGYSLSLNSGIACGPDMDLLPTVSSDVCDLGGHGGGNGEADPGEVVTISINAHNGGLTGATGISATLTTASPLVTMIQNSTTFPDIPICSSASNNAPGFQFRVSGGAPCGVELPFTLHFVANEASWDQDFTMTATPGSVVTLLAEAFETWPLTGWTIVDDAGSGCPWGSALGFWGRANGTGGSGDCADADSDQCGNGTTMDTTMKSPVFDLSSPALSSASLQYKTIFYSYYCSTSATGDVDITTDGGTTWTNVKQYTGLYGQASETLDITSFLGNTSVQLGFHYTSPCWDYLWEVDDVVVTGYSESFCAANTCCPTMALAPSSLPDGVTTVAYSQVLTPSAGTAPFTFAVSSGSLPTGLSLDGSTGEISGTPTDLGTFTFEVTVTESGGCSGKTSFSMTVVCPTITLSPATLPYGIPGVPYSGAVTALTGTAPFTFSTLSALPPGISLAADGTLSGTPTTSGTFPITVTAMDEDGCEGSRLYDLLILAFPSSPVITGISDVDPCSAGAITIAFSAGTPATRHDLYRDGALVLSGVSNPVNHAPGDLAPHSYVIRAVNTDEVCFTDSAPVSGADTSGTPSQPVITGIRDPDLTKFGLIITYTPGAPAVRHDLYKDGFLVVTGFASGSTYTGADNFFHQYAIVAVNGTCLTASAGVSARDMGTILRPKPRLPLEPLDFPR